MQSAFRLRPESADGETVDEGGRRVRKDGIEYGDPGLSSDCWDHCLFTTNLHLLDEATVPGKPEDALIAEGLVPIEFAPRIEGRHFGTHTGSAGAAVYGMLDVRLFQSSSQYQRANTSNFSSILRRPLEPVELANLRAIALSARLLNVTPVSAALIGRKTLSRYEKRDAAFTESLNPPSKFGISSSKN